MTSNENEIRLSPKCVKNQICFYAIPDVWALKITEKGLVFNREYYPNSKPEDFAIAFIEILEKCFTVNFTKKAHPYEKVE